MRESTVTRTVSARHKSGMTKRPTTGTGKRNIQIQNAGHNKTNLRPPARGRRGVEGTGVARSGKDTMGRSGAGGGGGPLKAE